MKKNTLSAALLAVYFLSNVFFSHALELNSLPARRDIVSQAVRMPLQLPGIQEKIPPSLFPVLEAIPSENGSIRDLYYAGNTSQPAPLVLIIQDVHLNFEAQRNIAAILLSLNKRQASKQISRPLAVGVEGAFGPFDFNRFRSFQNRRVIQSLADYFLNENRFAAPSYVGVSAERLALRMIGVDSRPSYKENLKSYLESQVRRDSVQMKVASARRALEERKTAALSAGLDDLDRRRNAYARGESGMGDYISYLLACSRRAGVMGSDLLETYVAAHGMEKKLNFSRIESERNFLFEKLASRLSSAELKEWAEESLAYRAGRVRFSNYYRSIDARLRRQNMTLAGTPAFEAYVRYALLSDGIRSEEIVPEMKRLEARLIRALDRSGLEEKIMDESRRIHLIERLIEFGLTAEEWDDYKLSFADRLRRDGELKSFESFYEKADARSDEMIENFLQAEPLKEEAAVLLVGGFHSARMAERLKERGLSYAVIQPAVSKMERSTGSDYLSIFTRGEKFLSPFQVADWPNRASSGFFAMMAQLYSHLSMDGSESAASRVRIEDLGGNNYRVMDLQNGTTFEVSAENEEEADLKITPGDLPATSWKKEAPQERQPRRRLFEAGLQILLDFLKDRALYDAAMILESSPDAGFGNKAVQLAKLASLRLPVPLAVALKPLAGESSFDNASPARLRRLTVDRFERFSGMIFGGKTGFPLLVSVRSSPVESQPGRFETLLNVGLNDETVLRIAGNMGEARAYRMYARFLIHYAELIYGYRDPDMEGLGSVRDWKEKVKELRSSPVYSDIPQNVDLQLMDAVRSVHKRMQGAPGGVIVQQMVFGNGSKESMSGVMMTSDPDTGVMEMRGTVAKDAQGDEVVMGESGVDLRTLTGEPALMLMNAAGKIRAAFPPQDVEFVIQHLPGYKPELFILQTRNAPMAVRENNSVDSSLTTLGAGFGLTGKRAVGRLVYWTESTEIAEEERPIIYAADPHNNKILDLIRTRRIAGLVTPSENPYSHVAIMARAAGIPVLLNFKPVSDAIPFNMNSVLTGAADGILQLAKDKTDSVSIELELPVLSDEEVAALQRDVDDMVRLSDIQGLQMRHTELMGALLELVELNERSPDQNKLVARLNTQMHLVHEAIQNETRLETEKGRKISLMAFEAAAYDWNRQMKKNLLKAVPTWHRTEEDNAIINNNIRVLRENAPAIPAVQALIEKYGPNLIIGVTHRKGFRTNQEDMYRVLVFRRAKMKTLFMERIGVGYKHRTGYWFDRTPEVDHAERDARALAERHPGSDVVVYVEVDEWHERGVYSADWVVAVYGPEKEASAAADSGSGGLMQWVRRPLLRWWTGKEVTEASPVYDTAVAPAIELAPAFAAAATSVAVLFIFGILPFDFKTVYIASWIAFFFLHSIDLIVYRRADSPPLKNFIAAFVISSGAIALPFVFPGLTAVQLILLSWLLHTGLNVALVMQPLAGRSLNNKSPESNETLTNVLRGAVRRSVKNNDEKTMRIRVRNNQA